MLAMSSLWRTNSGRSSAPTHAVRLKSGQRTRQRRAFGDRLGLVKPERPVHPRPHERAQVEEAADRRDANEARPLGRRQRPIEAGHARDEMAAGRVARERDRPGSAGRRGGDRPRDRLCDVADANSGRERIARHSDRPAAADWTFGEVRPEGFVEAHPEAAVDEDNETLRRTVRKEQGKPLAGTLAIGAIEFGAPGREPLAFEGRGAGGPQFRIDLGVADMAGVVVGVVPVGDHGLFLFGRHSAGVCRPAHASVWVAAADFDRGAPVARDCVADLTKIGPAACGEALAMNPMSNQPETLFVDVDTGIDDAFALLYACAETGARLLGVLDRRRQCEPRQRDPQHPRRARARRPCGRSGVAGRRAPARARAE